MLADLPDYDLGAGENGTFSPAYASLSDLCCSGISYRFHFLPVALADEGVGKEALLDLTTVHPSFTRLQNDPSPRAQLIKTALSDVALRFSNDLPIYLTKKGQDRVRSMTVMLTDLAYSDLSERDRLLYTYLSNVRANYTVHCDLSGATLVPNQSFSLPIGYQEVPGLYDSGVYGFFFTDLSGSQHLGLGSALSCRARLIDHLSRFNSTGVRQFMHKFVDRNGGISNLT